MQVGASAIRVACFASILIGWAAPPETVHDELVRLQRQYGLTLGAYYRGLDLVLFSQRKPFHGAELASVKAMEGAVSRDGTEVAVDLWIDKRGSSLAIMHPDGTALREFSEIKGAYGLCWSFDNSKLAMSLQDLKHGSAPPNDSLQVLTLSSKAMQEVDVRATVTQQCWSPDGKQIVYEADDSVRVFNAAQERWQVLAKGTNATWSPDGQWIAFLDDETYYAIRPSGEDRKTLFRVAGAMSGLMWSPDSRIVAYARSNRLFEPHALVDDLFRLRLRRLADNSEDWVDLGGSIPRYQWTNFATVKDK